MHQICNSPFLQQKRKEKAVVFIKRHSLVPTGFSNISFLSRILSFQKYCPQSTLRGSR